MRFALDKIVNFRGNILHIRKNTFVRKRWFRVGSSQTRFAERLSHEVCRVVYVLRNWYTAQPTKRPRTWGICTRRAGKRYNHSRLYRSQILQATTLVKALTEICTMDSFAPFVVSDVLSWRKLVEEFSPRQTILEDLLPSAVNPPQTTLGVFTWAISCHEIRSLCLGAVPPPRNSLSCM